MDRDQQKKMKKNYDLWCAITLFTRLISEIDISKYNQAEFREIVEAIHLDIFGKMRA
tara:strand:+ start:524 stop:694 length:171 start_codon:yes stop_codon:yes gene_type:complete